MKTSCGIILFDRETKQLLLCKPTGVAMREGNLMFPTGEIDEGETHWECAAREFFEETGLTITEEVRNQSAGLKFSVDYENKHGKVYKVVHLYFIWIHNIGQLNWHEKKPQLAEVDWVEFVPVKEAKKMIFWRFKELLEIIF